MLSILDKFIGKEKLEVMSFISIFFFAFSFWLCFWLTFRKKNLREHWTFEDQDAIFFTSMVIKKYEPWDSTTCDYLSIIAALLPGLFSVGSIYVTYLY